MNLSFPRTRESIISPFYHATKIEQELLIDKRYDLSYAKLVKYLEWSADKNEKLKRERGISFEEIQTAVEEKRVVIVIDHPKQRKYKGQKMMIINIEEYAYLVPFIDQEDRYFLKTIIPSRKATKKYIISKKEAP